MALIVGRVLRRSPVPASERHTASRVGDDELLVHYRQNPILFVRDDAYDTAARRALALAPPPLAALDQVHPWLFTMRLNE